MLLKDNIMYEYILDAKMNYSNKLLILGSFNGC